MKRRFFHYDNGVMVDFSTELNNYESGTTSIAITAAEDYLYIATSRPLNGLFFKVNNANVDAALVDKVEYYRDRQWNETVEVFDETSNGTSTLASSGYITFIPDREENWGRITDTSDGNQLDFPSDFKVYDRYWHRISFTADCTLDLAWIGQLFTKESVLENMIPDLAKSKVKSLFGNSYEQLIKIASDMLEDDLRRMNLLANGDQILERDELEIACAYKVAELIYSNRGPSYEDDRTKYEAKYKQELSDAMPTIDKNMDGRASAVERENRTGRLFR